MQYISVNSISVSTVCQWVQGSKYKLTAIRHQLSAVSRLTSDVSLLNTQYSILMTKKTNISGSFTPTLKPLDTYATGKHGMKLGRMLIDKTFEGELNAKSKGEMLSAMTPIKGSAGYVAIEQVEGTLSGKKGSFILQHFGIMNQGDQRLVLEVVPGSGTGELTGLTGSMDIIIKDGNHFYEFEYAFEKPS